MRTQGRSGAQTGGHTAGSARSTLFQTSSTGMSPHWDSTSRTASSGQMSAAAPAGPRRPPSTSSRMASAWRTFWRLRATPISSTLSPVSRRPAVSVRRTGRPSSWQLSSRKSRVVPGMSVTRARLRPSRALSRLDLPALTAPASTTTAPCCMTCARRWPVSRPRTAAATSSTTAAKASGARHSTSSSGKSTARLICTRSPSSCRRRAVTLRPSRPSRRLRL